MPFDLRSGEVRGTPVTVLAGVMTEPGSGAAQFAVASEAGALVFVGSGEGELAAGEEARFLPLN